MTEWYNPDWQYRKKVTIDRTKVAGTFNKFVMPVVIASDADLAANAKADGSDILFTLDDGFNKRNHELTKFDSGTGELIAWVAVPTDVSADTALYLYYGNSGASAQEEAEKLWNNQLTLHLREDPSGTAPQATDVTGEGNHGTSQGTMTSGDLVSGPVESAWDLDGTDDALTIADDPTNDLGAGDFTALCWFQSRSFAAEQQIFGKRADVSNRWEAYVDAADRVAVAYRSGGTWYASPLLSFSAMSTNTWYLLVFAWDASAEQAIVRVATEEQTATLAGRPNMDLASDLQIGWRVAVNDRYVNGLLSEIRYYKGTLLTKAWTDTMSAIEADPAAAISVANEEVYASVTSVNSGSALTPGATVSAVVDGFTQAPDTVRLTDGQDPVEVAVAQTISGTPTTTGVDFTVVLADGGVGLPYGSVVVEISDSVSGETATKAATLNPTGTNVYVDVANYPPPTGQLSVFDGASPGVQAGDQAELTTPSGSTSFTANSDGTLQVEPDGSYTLQARAWDSTDSTWGSWETTEINVATGASDLEKWSLLESNRIPLPDGTDGIDLQEKYVFLGAYAFSDAGDVAAPTLQAATIVSSTLRLTLSEAVQFGAGGSGGVSLSLSGGAATATYLTGEGTSTLTYSLSRSVAGSETGTLDYTQPGDGIEDLAGNDLASVSAETVAISAAGGAIFSIVIRRRRR